MAPGDQVFPDDLPSEVCGKSGLEEEGSAWTESLRRWASQELLAGKTDLFSRGQDELERVLIDCALDQTGGQRQKAAELLGLGRNTLTRKLQKFDSDREDELAAIQAAGGT
jgi:two-component system nitrogen regulation response regulator GlnG